jgi:hypothetical protein
MGKSAIKHPFSIAMLDYQRVLQFPIAMLVITRGYPKGWCPGHSLQDAEVPNVDENGIIVDYYILYHIITIDYSNL